MTEELKAWLYKHFYDKEFAHETFSVEDLLEALLDDIQTRVIKYTETPQPSWRRDHEACVIVLEELRQELLGHDRASTTTNT